MPNRILRPGINDSRAVNELSEGAENFYRRLFAVVDDYGRFEADPVLLRGELFKRVLDRWPVDRIEAALMECCSVLNDDGQPLVSVYRAKSKIYLEISNFGQRLQSKSKYPAPSEGTPARFSTVGHGGKPSHATRARSESESESESESNAYANTHTPSTANASQTRAPLQAPPRQKAECVEIPKPEPQVARIETDELWEIFRGEYGKHATPGGRSLTTEDFAIARSAWNYQSFEQKGAIIAAVASWVAHETDPRFWPQPVKFIRSDHKRQLLQRSPQSQPANRMQEAFARA